MDSTEVKILELSLDYGKPSISLETDWYVLIGIIVVVISLIFIIRQLKKRKFPMVEMEVEISGSPKVKFKARRDDSNLFIANRIYIELVTRKAALMFEDDKDVIVEVYDSWYKLFGIIRDEVKNVPGHYLHSHNSSNALIGLTTKILNDGLRPHLTNYQAEFRKWYSEELKKQSSENKSPHDIQKLYENHDELVSDLKRVNQVLIDYSKELEKLIKGS